MHVFATKPTDNGRARRRWGRVMDNSDIIRELMAPLIFGMIMLVVAVFPLLRGVPSSPFVWLRMVAAGGYGIYLIMFALNTIADMG
jgi:hypothetical protein